MALTRETKNKPVEVQIIRAFMYEGKVIAPKKVKKMTLPYAFAKEMETAGKVSFTVEKEIEVVPK